MKETFPYRWSNRYLAIALWLLASPATVGAEEQAKLRALADQTLEELKRIDAAMDRWTVEHKQPLGRRIKPLELRPYIPRETRLWGALGGAHGVEDLLRHSYSSFFFRVGAQPRVARETVTALEGVVPEGFWLDYADPPRGRRELTIKGRSQFAPMSKVIKDAPNASVYRGLPHPVWDQAALGRALSKSKTFQLYGYTFHEQPIDLTPEKVEALRKLCADAGSFDRWGGPKLCGGFNPDYALVWKDGAAECVLLICFGCGEVKLFSGAAQLYVDLTGETAKELKSLP